MNGPGIVNNWVVLLIILPMASGVITTLLRGRLRAQRMVGVVSLTAMAALAASWLVDIHPGGVMVSQMGGWPAPFGISVVFDELSGMLLTAASLVGLACLLFSAGADVERDDRTWFHPLTHLLIMGVSFSFLTGDLFNLFVAFEIMLMASYGLLCMGGSRKQLAQAYKYVMLNLIGSTFFVVGAGMVYGMMQTLNFADLAIAIEASKQPGGHPLPAAFPAVTTMLLFVFALKAAAFPLWFWLPDTYHTCPITISALFGGLLTKVGVYSVCRVFPMIFAAEPIRHDSPAVMILLIASAVTMLLAAFGALAVRELRRVLAMVLISSVGLQLFGAAMMTPGSLAGTTYYMTQSMLATAAGFLCCGLIERVAGTDNLDELGGLQKKHGFVSLLFFLVMLCLVGLPPLAGFFGKVVILREGFSGPPSQDWWAVAVVGLLASAVTLLALARVWGSIFWGPPRSRPRDQWTARTLGDIRPAFVGATILVAAITIMGVATEWPMQVSNSAGKSMQSGQRYAAAVMPEAQWPGAVRAAATDIPAHPVVAASPETHAPSEGEQ